MRRVSAPDGGARLSWGTVRRGVVLAGAALLVACQGPDVPFAAPGEPLPGLTPSQLGRFETGGVLNFEQLYFEDEQAALAASAMPDPRGQPISLPGNAERMPVAKVSSS